MRREFFDVVVLGVGGMGSATLYQLVRRGIRACGIEQFTAGHNRGSSHGDTRIIRKAYPEKADYIPLLNRAYELWEAAEAESGEKLIDKCGFLIAAPAGSAGLQEVAKGYQQYLLPYDYLKHNEIQKRFPQFYLPENYEAFFDPSGGVAYVDKSVRQFISLAKRNGAVLYDNEAVTDWEAAGKRITVRTSKREIEAEKLVIASGAWALPLLKKLGVGLEIWRRVTSWHREKFPVNFQPEKFPAFMVKIGELELYGCPAIDEKGVKIGEHTMPFLIDDPGEINLPLQKKEQEDIESCVRQIFPALNPQVQEHVFCMYTMSPDHHFILDHHPAHPQVCFGAGFSGHGFKFAPVIGEILADLALEGKTGLPVDFLNLDRFL